jgi:hypothetical protein
MPIASPPVKEGERIASRFQVILSPVVASGGQNAG